MTTGYNWLCKLPDISFRKARYPLDALLYIVLSPVHRDAHAVL